MDKLKIYLAGGLSSNWQHQVVGRFNNKFIFFNPREHYLNASIEYTTWDLFYIRRADIVFAYMEKDNPSGYGLTLEIGYAKALNKTIILVDERSSSDSFFCDKFKIVRDTSSVIFSNLEEGLIFLNSFNKGIINT